MVSVKGLKMIEQSEIVRLCKSYIMTINEPLTDHHALFN